ncbi:hypothetical protein FRC01_011528 [Tulasnella sp. 417]|nr:hypothetical protein FRC01_011528 [Tulasnella sp. 417]
MIPAPPPMIPGRRPLLPPPPLILNRDAVHKKARFVSLAYTGKQGYKGESSDDDEEFLGVAEGKEEYVEEWDSKDGDMRGDNEERMVKPSSNEESYRSSSTGNRTEKGEEEMSSKEGESGTEDKEFEDDETDADAEEPLANGYDADCSGADSGQESYQNKRQRPRPRSFVSQRNRGRGYTQASVPSHWHKHPHRGIETSSLSELFLRRRRSAVTFSDDDGTMNPDVVPNAQLVQESPNTSTESATLLGTIREGFSATLHVNPSTILGPDVLASVNDDED